MYNVNNLVGELNEEKQLTGKLNEEKQLVGELNNINSSYPGLVGKPLINGVVLEGDKSSIDLKIIEDKTFMHKQEKATKTWNIQHNLKKFPSVVVIDSSGNVVLGDIEYVDENNVIITFSGAFSGKCFCN